MDILDLTKKEAGHTIGDGRHTKFWIHKCIDGKDLLLRTIQEVPNEHKNRLACEYWRHNMGGD